MQCLELRCLNELTGRQMKFCSKLCQNRYNTGVVLYTKSTTITGKECKWCMDSEKGFCCKSHEAQYESLRRGINSELAIRKPKPTAKQERHYAKIRDFLNKPIDR